MAPDAEEVNRYLICNQLGLLEQLKKTTDAAGMWSRCRAWRSCAQRGAWTPTIRCANPTRSAILTIPLALWRDFDRRDYLFEIPYRALVKTGYRNIITAGRSAAGDGYAWDVIRVIPPAAITGQAAVSP